MASVGMNYVNSLFSAVLHTKTRQQMLTPATKKCYEFARTNDDFHKALITDSMKNRKPNIFSDDVDRALYASVYYGWLIAKAGDGHKGAEAQLIILKELRSE